MKLNILAITGALGLASAGCAHNPVVLGSEIELKALCPSAGAFCSQNIGNVRAISITREERYLPAERPGVPDVWTYLGREYTPDASQIVNFCGNEATNPLRTYADSAPTSGPLVMDTVATNSVDFVRKVRARSSFATNIDIDAMLNAAGIPTGTPRVIAEAALHSALERLNNSDLHLKGRYNFVYLKPSIVALLTANVVPPELKACSDALRAGAKPIIVSMTFVQIDTMTTSGTLKNDVNASLDAALTGKLDGASLASLKAELGKTVDVTYSTEFSPTWKVLSIGGYAGR